MSQHLVWFCWLEKKANSGLEVVLNSGLLLGSDKKEMKRHAHLKPNFAQVLSRHETASKKKHLAHCMAPIAGDLLHRTADSNFSSVMHALRQVTVYTLLLGSHTCRLIYMLSELCHFDMYCINHMKRTVLSWQLS